MRWQLECAGKTPYIEVNTIGRKRSWARGCAGHGASSELQDHMSNLDDIYNQRIFELAAAIPRAVRLTHPDAAASAHSKLCGSTVSVELKLDGRRISDFGQTVKACLLGQASASIVGREIVGTTAEEFHEVANAMRRMLKEKGPPPEGRWADLRMLEPVRDYPHRHASTLLVFDAVERALAEAETRSTAGAAAAR
jgi:NifU-like protein involved in Fe-S cluster formation